MCTGHIKINDEVMEMENVENKRIYQQIKALEKDPMGFLKLSSVLKPSKYSVEDLRDEYISEKYGIPVLTPQEFMSRIG